MLTTFPSAFAVTEVDGGEFGAIQRGDGSDNNGRPDVRRIDKRGDSLKNGALIGAVVGLVSGLAGLELTPTSIARRVRW